MLKVDKRYKRAGNLWMPKELDYLGNCYGLVPSQVICRHLHRSPLAIKIAARRKLHITLTMNFYTDKELSTALGIYSGALKSWVNAGWLKARRSFIRTGHYQVWHFDAENIEKFLYDKPWLFNPKKMPQHYFRSIVREEYDKDPWYTYLEAAPLLGVKSDWSVRRYISRGWLPVLGETAGPLSVSIIRRSSIEHFLANDPRSQLALNRLKRVPLAALDRLPLRV